MINIKEFYEIDFFLYLQGMNYIINTSTPLLLQQSGLTFLDGKRIELPEEFTEQLPKLDHILVCHKISISKDSKDASIYAFDIYKDYLPYEKRLELLRDLYSLGKLPNFVNISNVSRLVGIMDHISTMKRLLFFRRGDILIIKPEHRFKSEYYVRMKRISVKFGSVISIASNDKYSIINTRCSDGQDYKVIKFDKRYPVIKNQHISFIKYRANKGYFISVI